MDSSTTAAAEQFGEFLGYLTVAGMVAGFLAVVAYVYVTIWASTEVFFLDRKVWLASGHSRLVTLVMILAVPFGPFVFAVAIRPTIFRAQITRAETRGNWPEKQAA